MTAPDDAPSPFPWPPVLLVGGIAGGYALRALVPLTLPVPAAVGLVPLVVAFAIDAWVFELFRRHGTNVRPDRPALALVTTGPFRWSRNPIYVGNVLFLIAFACFARSGWFFAMAGVFAILCERLAILPEEAHLRAKFGPAFDAWAARTRRWI